MSQESLKLPPEHTISQEDYNKLQRELDAARSELHKKTKAYAVAKWEQDQAAKRWKAACLALPSVITHTDTKILELVEKGERLVAMEADKQELLLRSHELV